MRVRDSGWLKRPNYTPPASLPDHQRAALTEAFQTTLDAAWSIIDGLPRNNRRGGMPHLADTPVHCGHCGNRWFELWATNRRTRKHIQIRWMDTRDGGPPGVVFVRCNCPNHPGVVLDLRRLVHDKIHQDAEPVDPWGEVDFDELDTPAPPLEPMLIGTGSEARRYPHRVWRPSKPAGNHALTAR